jgi:hypothetical protein
MSYEKGMEFKPGIIFTIPRIYVHKIWLYHGKLIIILKLGIKFYNICYKGLICIYICLGIWTWYIYETVLEN